MLATAPGPIVLWLSSRYENIELAQAALAHVCRLRGIDGEMEHWIGMAMREAVANAVKHGNRLDPDKRVLVKLESAGDDLTIVVGDEGGGFDPERISDPLAPENHLKTSGRGIFYIRTFMDDVSFSRGEGGGTVLTMRKDLSKRGNAKGEKQ
jgi:serine/threonine-protein kinase RsbW